MSRYIIIYFLIGIAFAGSVHLRQWWMTRRFRYKKSLVKDFLLLPVTAWFWPLLMYLSLRDGLPQFSDHSENPEVQATERRSRDRKAFMHQMPYCSAVIRIDVSAFPENLNSAGVLYFEAEAVWNEMSQRVNQNPHLAQDDEGYLLSWLATRNSEDRTPSDSPIAFPRLAVCADVLIRERHGYAECRRCGKTYPMQNLTYRDDAGNPTSNYNQVLCPHGHPLLKRLRIRFIRTSPR